jgi:hypothetical protein
MTRIGEIKATLAVTQEQGHAANNRSPILRTLMMGDDTVL